jgi:hypothetical protein
MMVKLHISPQTSGSRVCLTDPATVRAWCAEMKCTENELRAAVYAVGSEPFWIRKYFSQ